MGIGVIAGLRTTVPSLLLTRAYREGIISLRPGGPLGVFTKKGFARLAPVNVLGEIVVDKLPFMPSRAQFPAITGRLASGGAAAVAISRGAGRSQFTNSLFGVVGALAGSFAGNHARAFAVQQTGLPDIVFALAEDGVALGGGYLLLRSPKLGFLLLVTATAAALRLPGQQDTAS